jgi:hypothetical protein
MAADDRADCYHDARYRALVLLATFASLRWGEVIVLCRCDLDLDRRTVRVRAAYAERSTGEMLLWRLEPGSGCTMSVSCHNGMTFTVCPVCRRPRRSTLADLRSGAPYWGRQSRPHARPPRAQPDAALGCRLD